MEPVGTDEKISLDRTPVSEGGPNPAISGGGVNEPATTVDANSTAGRLVLQHPVERRSGERPPWWINSPLFQLTAAGVEEGHTIRWM